MSLSKRDKLIKLSTGKLIKEVGGVDAAECISRVNRSTFSRYASTSEEHEKTFIPMDVILDLEEIIVDEGKVPVALETVCRHLGGTFIKVPEHEPTFLEVNKFLAAMTNEFSDVLSKSGKGLLDDGELSANEIKEHNIIKECDDLVGVIIAYREHLKLKVSSSE